MVIRYIFNANNKILKCVLSFIAIFKYLRILLLILIIINYKIRKQNICAPLKSFYSWPPSYWLPPLCRESPLRVWWLDRPTWLSKLGMLQLIGSKSTTALTSSRWPRMISFSLNANSIWLKLLVMLLFAATTNAISSSEKWERELAYSSPEMPTSLTTRTPRTILTLPTTPSEFLMLWKLSIPPELR